MNEKYYNNYAWYHSNITNKSKTIYQNMHVNDTVKKLCKVCNFCKVFHIFNFYYLYYIIIYFILFIFIFPNVV